MKCPVLHLINCLVHSHHYHRYYRFFVWICLGLREIILCLVINLTILIFYSAASEKGGSVHISVSTGVFAGLFIVCLMTLVGLLVYNAKKAKAQDRMYLLSSF